MKEISKSLDLKDPAIVQGMYIFKQPGIGDHNDYDDDNGNDDIDENDDNDDVGQRVERRS